MEGVGLCWFKIVRASDPECDLIDVTSMLRSGALS
jgi:hypothetical protein